MMTITALGCASKDIYFNANSDINTLKSIEKLRIEYRNDKQLLDALTFYKNGGALHPLLAISSIKKIDTSETIKSIPAHQRFKELHGLDKESIKIIYNHHRKNAQDAINQTDEENRIKEHIRKSFGYAENLDFFEVHARRNPTSKTPEVRLSLTNKGERIVKLLIVTVYFYGKSGEIIYEDDITLISPSDPELKPGYSHEDAPGSFTRFDTALSKWDDGKISIDIANIDIR